MTSGCMTNSNMLRWLGGKRMTRSFSTSRKWPRADSADLGLRINATYPFMGLTLIVEQFSYPDRKRRVDTVNCKLMDSNGKMKGYGIGSFQYTFHITDLDLQQGDSLHIGVRHDMKREILPGISDIGIILKKE